MSRPLFRDRVAITIRPRITAGDETLAARLAALSEQRREETRRNQWRRAAGTDGNGHAERNNPGDQQ